MVRWVMGVAAMGCLVSCGPADFLNFGPEKLQECNKDLLFQLPGIEKMLGFDLLSVNCTSTSPSTSTTLFYVADDNNNRIMVFDVTSITNGENAVNVLGQSSFTTSTAAITQSGLNLIIMRDTIALDSTNSRLFVSDYSNHRVMVFDVASITNGENAVNVLGQSDFTTRTRGTTQSKLKNPTGLAYVSPNLYVSDNNNHRVMVFDVTSITDGENAVNVLGQSDFTTATTGTTQSKLSGPSAIAYLSPNLYVASDGNHRVMVFDVSSITDGENAVNVLGQSDFTTGTNGTTQSKLNTPEAVQIIGSNLYVSDNNNNRIMIFDVSSITDGENAVNVLGQSSFTTSTSSLTQSGLNMPIVSNRIAERSLDFTLDGVALK